MAAATAAAGCGAYRAPRGGGETRVPIGSSSGGRLCRLCRLLATGYSLCRLCRLVPPTVPFEKISLGGRSGSRKCARTPSSDDTKSRLQGGPRNNQCQNSAFHAFSRTPRGHFRTLPSQTLPTLTNILGIMSVFEVSWPWFWYLDLRFDR